MDEISLFIKVRTQPGMRDEVRAVWERHLKPRAEASDAQTVYLYTYDDSDPDVIHIFELYKDRAALGVNAEAPWFASYMAEVAPFLAGPPEVAMATPVWSKVPKQSHGLEHRTASGITT